MNNKTEVRNIPHLGLHEIFALELFSKLSDEMQSEVINLMKDILSR